MEKVVRDSDINSCRSKKSYDTIDQANDAGKLSMYTALELNNTQPIQLYIYECPNCDKYHLTRYSTDIKVF